MQHTQRLESKVANWKEKAMARNAEIQTLRRLVASLTKSRAEWKAKAVDRGLQLRKYEAELDRLRKQVEKHESQLLSQRPARHHYSLLVISLALAMRLEGGSSLRGSIRILERLRDWSLIEGDIPCFSTIRNWERKLGHYHLEKQVFSDQPVVVILDESMQLGQQSVLAILQADESAVFGGALSLANTQVLKLKVRSSWRGEDIAEELRELQARGHSISYVVSDGGTAIKKALKLLGLTRIEDCTHALGGLLEKRYQNDPTYEAFSKAASKLRKQLSMSKYSEYTPPKQRHKGRYLNLMPLAQWGRKTLDLWDQQGDQWDEKLKQPLAWLPEYRAFIDELYQANLAFHRFAEPLKQQGLSAQTQQQILQMITKDSPPQWFADGTKAYLERNLPHQDIQYPCICTSDIIESFFGKLKYRLEKAPNNHLTDSILTMAQAGKPIEPHFTQQAMEKTKLVDFVKWKKQNLTQKDNRKRSKNVA
jgi:hypothetical protein